jgi:hypothetical protein
VSRAPLNMLLDVMSGRWSIHIDVEGFGAKWKDTAEAFRGLNALMAGIYRIGARVYPEPPERLFAHQFGDGFLVVSDFHEERLDRAVLVSIALLRHVLASGAVAKAAIAEGDLSDVVGCYPPEIRHQPDRDHIIFGSGIMTVFPVMGTALINAVAVDKRCPSGPLLAIAPANLSRCPPDVPSYRIDNTVACLNWLVGEPHGLHELQAASGFKSYSKGERRAQFEQYLVANPELSETWKLNSQRYLLS